MNNFPFSFHDNIIVDWLRLSSLISSQYGVRFYVVVQSDQYKCPIMYSLYIVIYYLTNFYSTGQGSMSDLILSVAFLFGIVSL